jgi:hypothetical protein
MSTTVYEAKSVTLLDGTKIEIKPLKISLLKPFTKKFQELSDTNEDNEKAMDILIECVMIAMQQFAPEYSEDREKLEDNIDLPTVYKIIEVSSGIQLADAADMLSVMK